MNVEKALLNAQKHCWELVNAVSQRELTAEKENTEQNEQKDRVYLTEIDDHLCKPSSVGVVTSLENDQLNPKNKKKTFLEIYEILESCVSKNFQLDINEATERISNILEEKYEVHLKRIKKFK